MSTNRNLPRSISLFATAVLLVGTSALPASELGRLFTTPDERMKIDAMRKGEAVAHSARGDATGTTAVDHLTLNGTLRSSNGRQRVWINGEGVSPTGASAPATMLYDGRVRLQWQSDGTSATLKPGQTLDKVTGDVYEAYESPVADAVPVVEE